MIDFDSFQSEIRKWRTEVSKSPRKFADLCRELDALPAVERLTEWSNWMTPHGIAAKRFDAAFYLTHIDQVTVFDFFGLL